MKKHNKSVLWEGRKAAKLTQKQAAAKLGVSQPYLSLIERGQRRLPAKLAKKAVALFELRATSLPLEHGEKRFRDLGKQLAALGYPGFAHLTGGRRSNPAPVLLAALATADLQSRLFEALPWLLLHYSDMDREWLVTQARLRNLSNRLGFVVTLAKKVCEQRRDTSSIVYCNLKALETDLQQSRLDREEAFGKSSISAQEIEWLKRHRSPEAAYWHVLSDWKPEYLQYV
jgi:transcriptional regulator with XRE-family HTH domain